VECRPTSQVVYHLLTHFEPTGHFYFTKLLIPVLTATAKKTPAGTVRVVNVSSLGHHYGPPEGISWATLAPGNDSLAARKKLGVTKLYGQSKLVRCTNQCQQAT
jgi:NAD(P)-dependent dehydrogenase (short-subunit alcohol dehydrogenase family)